MARYGAKWRVLRQEFLDFLEDNHQMYCLKCREPYRRGFHIHHRTYDKPTIYDLELLCESCHVVHHLGKKKKPR